MTATIKVRTNFSLVGKTQSKNGGEITNKERIDKVLSLVEKQFGNRPVYVVDAYLVGEESRKYPDYFAAGWFLSEPSENKQVSELVVVGHGNSMKTAKDYMLSQMKNIDWVELSRSV